jgi:hypothetical protein
LEKLSDIIGDSVKNYGIGEAAFAAVFVARAQKIVTDLMGQASLSYITVKKLEQHKVFVTIKNAAWAQEFHFNKRAILEKLRTDFPEKRILDIVIYIKGKEGVYDI